MKERCDQNFRTRHQCRKRDSHKGLHEAYCWSLGIIIYWNSEGDRILKLGKKIPKDAENGFPEYDEEVVPLPEKISRKRVLEFIQELKRDLKSAKDCFRRLKDMAKGKKNADIRSNCKGVVTGVNHAEYHLKNFTFNIKTLKE